MNERREDEDPRDAMVRHAARTAPAMEPPPGFAAMMEAAVQDQPERAALEKWLLGIVFALMPGSVALLAAPVFTRAFDALAGRLSGAPWFMLLAAGLVLGAIALPDVSQARRVLSPRR